MKIKLGFAVIAALAAIGGKAEAVPYAYASNQYSNLRLLLVVGGNPQALPVTGTPTETIAATAQYQGFPLSGGQASQAIAIFPNVAPNLNITQAFAGIGTVPAENTFGQAGPGTFTGTRSDSTIGGANSQGFISAANVAEGNGTLLGNSTANNNATIVFSVTLATVGQISLTFDNLVNLIASTSLVGESATAAVANTFSISQGGIGGVSYTFAPGEINGQLSSQDGVPLSANYGPLIYSANYLSPLLGVGTYNISLTSSSSETIQGVPEPASLAVLGVGLLGLGMFRRHRQS